ncbi:MAG: YggT family protein [Candidatus Nanopelagicales bacterium]
MGAILYTVLYLYFWVMIGRLVIDYVQIFSRTWAPSGGMLVVVEAVYSITDPPLKFFRRFIPPLRLGAVSLDLSFIVVIILLQIAMGIARGL